MIRENRELLVELNQLNTAMAPLVMRVTDGSASVAEQQDYAQRWIAAGERLQRRADGTAQVIEGEVLVDTPPALSTRTWKHDHH
ncbi:MAG: hypothetical protein ACRDTH_02395 [Pseudonocardiaceae bacterium]